MLSDWSLCVADCACWQYHLIWSCSSAVYPRRSHEHIFIDVRFSAVLRRVQGRCTSNHSYKGLTISCNRVVTSQILDGGSCVTLKRKFICWTKLLRTASVQGGQAPLENQTSVPPPKYVFARRNCWPGYLPKPKRLARDNISTCDCHPSDSGLQSHRTGLLMSSISPLQTASKAYVCYNNQKHSAKGV